MDNQCLAIIPWVWSEPECDYIAMRWRIPSGRRRQAPTMMAAAQHEPASEPDRFAPAPNPTFWSQRSIIDEALQVSWWWFLARSKTDIWFKYVRLCWLEIQANRAIVARTSQRSSWSPTLAGMKRRIIDGRPALRPARKARSARFSTDYRTTTALAGWCEIGSNLRPKETNFPIQQS